jgi:uncharacterized protein
LEQSDKKDEVENTTSSLLPPPRVLLDTNVLVSAIISRGKARELLNRAIVDKKFSIVISEAILKELRTVLQRPKFKTSKDEIDKIILAIIQTGEIISPESDFKVINEDPDDNIILNAAYDGKVNMIITGDDHLLGLQSFKGIRILRITEAISEL